LLVFLDPHKCRDFGTVLEKRDFSYFVIRAVITVHDRSHEGRGEWKVVGVDFNMKLEAGRQAQIRLSARDK
jgi:hypothetical protein